MADTEQPTENVEEMAVEVPESRGRRRGKRELLNVELTEKIDMNELASAYVDLQLQIKKDAAAVAALRKTCKEMSDKLLAVMKENRVQEVSAKGVTIQRTTKLEVKL